MAEQFIEEIYEISDIITELQRVVFELRQNRRVQPTRRWSACADVFQKIINELAKDHSADAQELYQAGMSVRKILSDNPLCAADYLEETVIPALYRCVARFGKIDVSEGDYRLVSSKSGFLNLELLSSRRFLYGMSNPMYEAWIQATDLIQEKSSRYHIFGVGLGYLPYQIWKEMEGAARVVIYEIGSTAVEYAKLYGVLDWIPEDGIEIKTFDTVDLLLDDYLQAFRTEKQSYFYISPWISNLYPNRYLDTINGICEDERVRREFQKLWKINSSRNLLKTRHGSDELVGRFDKKDWVVVAAGPSLDDQMQFLRESVGKRTIAVVNTVLKKVLKAGIQPDLVVALDPSAVLVKHVEGVEELTKGIPLLVDALGCCGFVEKYQGPVYLQYTRETEGVLEPDQIVEKTRWGTGGTVTHLAVQAAIRYGAENVYLIGVDLGYPGKRRYAEDVAHKDMESEGDFNVRSNTGGEISTNRAFVAFRNALETLIFVHRNVHYYNLSSNGAYIRGTFTFKWWEENDSLEVKEDFCRYLERLKTEPALTWNEKYYIFWQILYAAKEKELDKDESIIALFQELFLEIYEGFAVELETSLPVMTRERKQVVYCFVADYGVEPWDRDDSRLRALLARIPSNKTVLIINTVETLGGQRRALNQEIFRKYPSASEGKETIRIGNREYAYHQFADFSQDMQFTLEFMQFVNNMPPSEVYSASEFSLVAEYVKRHFGK